jgi:hypothetical protein
MKMSASNVICFDTFRSERNRGRSKRQDDEPEATVAPPFQDRLATVMLSPRQIAHRRAMLDFGDERRRRLTGTLIAGVTERG